MLIGAFAVTALTFTDCADVTMARVLQYVETVYL